MTPLPTEMGPSRWRRLRDAVSNPRVLGATTLGFASGLPFNLSQGTLQAWMSEAGVDLKSIGLLTLVSMPYTFKFLWAPVLDRFALPWLGRRRGWITLFQLLLALTIAWVAFQQPSTGLQAFAVGGFLIALFSASQDIVIDAWRTDTLRPEERGLGSTATQLGWRTAAIVSGGLALVLAGNAGWQTTWLLLAALTLAGIVLTWYAPEPERVVRPPSSLALAITGPWQEFFSRPGACSLLALIVLYKFGDAFALTLNTAFLIKGAGFTVAEVGAVAKTVNLVATLTGTVFGGVLFVYLGLLRSLLVFGLAQAVTNLLYAWLATVGHSFPVMILAVGVDNFAGGMGATAFGALVMALCDVRFSAAQFALLSALSAVARTFLGPLAAVLVDGGRFSGTLLGQVWLVVDLPALGWAKFFVVTFFTALPGIALVWWQRTRLRALDPAA